MRAEETFCVLAVSWGRSWRRRRGSWEEETATDRAGVNSVDHRNEDSVEDAICRLFFWRLVHWYVMYVGS
jgi:hypothetical protein